MVCPSMRYTNWNEGIHSLIWRRAPKDVFTSTDTVSCATFLALIQNNEGLIGVHEFLGSLGLATGDIYQAEKNDRHVHFRQKYLAKNPRKKFENAKARNDNPSDYCGGNF